jgi:hypothetical protein
MLELRPIALNAEEKESTKKLKYLKYNNNPTPLITPKVDSNFDFLSLLVLSIAFPKRKTIIVEPSNKGIILQLAYP